MLLTARFRTIGPASAANTAAFAAGRHLAPTLIAVCGYSALAHINTVDQQGDARQTT